MPGYEVFVRPLLTGYDYTNRVMIEDEGNLRVYQMSETDRFFHAWLHVISEHYFLRHTNKPALTDLAAWVYRAGDPTEFDRIKDAIYVGAIHALTLG